MFDFRLVLGYIILQLFFWGAYWLGSKERSDVLAKRGIYNVPDFVSIEFVFILFLSVVLFGALNFYFYPLATWGTIFWIILPVFTLFLPSIYDEIRIAIWMKNNNNTKYDIDLEDDVNKPILRKRRAIPQKVKDQVWNRDGGKCVQCGSNENLEFDHIIPHSKGGADTYRNLQLLCQPCNSRKSNKIG